MVRRIDLGVDSSTRSVKIEARDLAIGELVAASSVKHPRTTPPVSEPEPRAWWAALADAMGDLGEVARATVVAVSVAGLVLGEGGAG